MAESKREKTSIEVTKRQQFDSEEYLLRKRLPSYLPKRDNDVYVNMNSNFKSQIAKCERIIESGQFKQLYIHGLGLAVDKAINLALQLQNTYQFDISVNTSSVNMIDDLQPIGANKDHMSSLTQMRTVSAIHIRLSHQ